MTNYVYILRKSDHPMARFARKVYRAVVGFSMPAPRVLATPIFGALFALGACWFWIKRVFVAEPYLKSKCARYGEGLKTGCFMHYFSGVGRFVVGDRVRMDGKSSVMFASVLPETPELILGDDTYVNHGATFIIARRITIGSKVLIGPSVTIFDSPGHPLDPEKRASGAPPSPEEIKEVVIQDRVWICTGACIFPGVTIGEGSVVALGAIVTKDVPPRSLVAGSPARIIRNL